MRKQITLLLLLFTAIIGLFWMSSYEEKPSTIAKEIQHNLDQLLTAQQAHLDDFEDQFGVYTNPFAIETDDSFYIHVYINGGLVFWNTNEDLPSYSALKRNDSVYSIEDDRGIYIIRRSEVFSGNDLVEIFSVIPVLQVAPIQNQYLNNEYNERLFESFEVSLSESAAYQFSDGQEELFAANISKHKYETVLEIAFCLMLLAVLFVFFWWNRYLDVSHKSIWMLSFLIVMRLVFWVWSFKFIDTWPLFDPVVFTAGWLHPTLGDFLLNASLLLGVCYVFFRYFTVPISHFFIQIPRYVAYAVIGISLAGMAYISFETPWILLDNSQINLDISSSIKFELVRVSAYASIMAIALSVLLFTSVLIKATSNIRFTFLEVLIVASVSLFVLIINTHFWPAILIILPLWFVLRYFQFHKTISKFTYQTFVYLVSVLAAMALVFAVGIYKHFEKDELVAKEKFANRLLIRNDILGEYYLSQITQEIANDRYVRTRLLSKLLARQNIREKIKRQFLSTYFNKYDIGVYLFDHEGNELQSEISDRDYSDWEKAYQEPRYQTAYEGIYFVSDDGENVGDKYICFLEIEAYGRRVGFIILELTLKKYIPSSVFPELLMESKYFMGEFDAFDYAVYRQNEIIYKQGRHGFENKLSDDFFSQNSLYESGIEVDGFHYYGLTTSDGRTILIVSDTYSFQSLLANFSFLFLVLLFISGLIFLTVGLLSDRSRFNLSTKIQVYLGLSFIVPMLIVSIALINTLNTSYREEIDKNFQKRSYNVAENITDQSESFYENEINIDEYANQVAIAASLSQSDINVYDVYGELITSSQPEIFRQGLLSNLINPSALYEIKFQKEQNIITSQSIGSLDFKTSYTAIRSYKDGQLLAILSMPYFDSKNHLRRQQIEVFNNLIVIFTFIFLLALFLGNLIVGQLVSPLKSIGDKLRKTSLQETNEPIHYEAKDEIGSLVQEYNQMLIKLEESKQALAASQKESAWKEIAKQVAHEIKNPITPMRLKIQQMMRAFDPTEKNYKTCEALIGQIDSLSSIADSFSEFAKMPAPNYEIVDVVSLTDEVLELHQSSLVKLIKSYNAQRTFALVDPKLFGRILTNIVLNAYQANATSLVVSITNQQNKVLLQLEDDGDGIPNDQKENIFTPYFSTKSSGSGIGLAVAKKGIENAGGNIWFESEEGKGTTFFISMPIHHPV